MNISKIIVMTFFILSSLNSLGNNSIEDDTTLTSTESESTSSERSLFLNEEELSLPEQLEQRQSIDTFQDLLQNPRLRSGGGFSSGGGGNSVVCFSKNGKLAEVSLLDYYEGIRKDNSLVKEINLAGDSVEEKIVNALSTLEKEYPRLTTKLKNRALWLHSNIDTYLIDSKDGKLSPVYDMNIPFVPQFNEEGDECQIVRFAVQSKEHVEGQKKFFFVKDLYNHPLTSDTTRAGIILHEIIYEEAILNKSVNSDFVRWLTYLISSKKISQMTSNEIQGLQYQPGGEFLGSLGVEVNSRRVMSYDFTDISTRERVYALDIYDIETSHGKVSCHKLGLCELFDGEFLGRKRGSSDFLPRFNVMMKNNNITLPFSKRQLEKKRGENLILSNDNIANRKNNVCTKDGACVGDLVGVTTENQRVSLSYTGVISGIFGDGNFAIEVIDGRFDILGSDINLNALYDYKKKVVLYASKRDVSF